MKQIRMLAMDVDGTLTDGRLYISPQGELCKAFDGKDGYGIAHILPSLQIVPVIITGRISDIVAYRCKELGIVHCCQGVGDKAACLRTVAQELSVPLSQAACIGDDENDLPMMQLCRLKGCPSDAVGAVQARCDYICKAAGGRGAVREFIEWLAGG